MKEEKLYLVGKDWKDGKIVKHQGTYYSFDDAKTATDRGYAVYDEEGHELYRNKSKRFMFLVVLFIFAFIIIGIGATFSIINYIKNPGVTPGIDAKYNYYNLDDGTIIKYGKNQAIIPYSDGKIVIPEGGALITFPDGTEKDLPPGTIILPDGTIIIPDKTPPIIDEYGNVITQDDKSIVISPKCGEREVPKGTIIRPNETLIIPTNGGSVYIDEHNYVRVNGSATVVLPNCKEIKVGDGAVITAGTDKDSGGTNQTIVDPNGTKPTVDSNGNIITNNDSGKILNNCVDQTSPKGTIIRPDGTIIIPHSGSTLTIDKYNNVVVRGKATVIMPDCKKYDISSGSIITPGDNNSKTGTKNNEDHTTATIIDPNGRSNPTVDDKGNITVPGDGGKVIIPSCGEKNITAGTLVRPNGTIYIPTSGSKVYVNSNNEVVVEGKATMIKPDCSESTITGTIKDNDEKPPVCDSTKKCCDGDTYATNKNCKKPDISNPPEEPDTPVNLALLYVDGNYLVANDINPGDTIGTKLFSVKNVGDGNVTYNILWTDVINPFTHYEDLVVTIKRDGNVIQSQRVLPRSNGIMLGDIQLNVGEKHNYELDFEYLYRNTDQNADQRKTFSTAIKIEGYRYIED